MKNFVWIVIFTLVVSQPVISACHCSHGACHCAGHSHYSHSGCHSSSSGNSHPVYLINQTFSKEEQKFPDCDKHYAVTEITTNIYSDGTKRVLTKSTIYNSDGSVLVENCQNVKHVIEGNDHYFLIRNNKGYQIINSSGEVISSRKYPNMDLLNPSRIVVRYNKRYGIIDLHENVIVPIKYQKLENVGKDMFKTKLNRYYGLIDVNNKVFVDDTCDSIKPLFDTYLIKREHKYGLVGLDGHEIMPVMFDKIKPFGGYILVKNGERYGILDVNGYPMSKIEYKKVKLERNQIKCLTGDNHWIYLLKKQHL